jgi:hypothetical protein
MIGGIAHVAATALQQPSTPHVARRSVWASRSAVARRRLSGDDAGRGRFAQLQRCPCC